MVQQGRLRLRLEAQKPVTVSSRQVDPYCLARENALFPYKDAKQFTRNKPFILIFIVHPWFNAGSIGIDFAGADTTFTRSLEQRVETAIRLEKFSRAAVNFALAERSERMGPAAGPASCFKDDERDPRRFKPQSGAKAGGTRTNDCNLKIVCAAGKHCGLHFALI
jgi:hypothetical protein